MLLSHEPPPECKAAGSFDRLIGSQQKTGGNVESECLRGLQIDDQFKVGRLLDRQIRRLNAL